MVNDGELVQAARQGDAVSLALLLERHRVPLLGLAISLLSNGQDAEDVVQDACLAALAGIERVRDPDAAGAWLRAVTRNLCYSRLRRSRPEYSLDGAVGEASSIPPLPSPEEAIDRLALRDWVWAALAELPEPLRVTAMLRFFSSCTSYEQIAALLGVPAGTVASRLSQVKIKLADALLRTAGLAHDEVRTQGEEIARLVTDGFAEYERSGRLRETLGAFLAEDVVARNSFGTEVRGRETVLADIMARGEADQRAGISLRLNAVWSSQDVTILETMFVGPPGVQFACPPFCLEVHVQRDRRTHHLYRAFQTVPATRTA
jgi:RNA polymerase sigma-70 factor (ECF subfamily)